MKKSVFLIILCIMIILSSCTSNNTPKINPQKNVKYNVLKGNIYEQKVKDDVTKEDDDEENGPYVKTVVYDESYMSLEDHLNNIIDFIKSQSDYNIMKYEVIGYQNDRWVEYLSFTFTKQDMKKALADNVNAQNVHDYTKYFFINPPLSDTKDVRISKEYGSDRVIRTEFKW